MEGNLHTAPSAASVCAAPDLSQSTTLITHTAGSNQVAELIASSGGNSVHLPLLEIVPKKISRLKHKACYEADMWIFLSQHSSETNCRLLTECIDTQTIIAIGPGTAEKIQSVGLPVDVTPKHDFSSKGILSLDEIQQAKPQKILIFSEATAPQYLCHELKKLVHAVLHIPTYQQQPVPEQTFIDRLNAATTKLDYVTAHSQNGLCHLLRIIRQCHAEIITEATLLVTSSAMQKLALKNGFSSVILSANNNPTEIVHMIANDYARRPT